MLLVLNNWSLKEHKQSCFIYPYDYGRMENFLQVVNWKCTPVRDGYYWPVVEGCTQFSFNAEKLRQKEEKRARRICCEVIRSYSGNRTTCYCSFYSCIYSPGLTEPRMAIKPCEKIMVSRITKYWFYGEKLLSESEAKAGKRERGWFPSQCVVGCNSRLSKDCESGIVLDYMPSLTSLTKVKAL